jgi:TolA-binding protein
MTNFFKNILIFALISTSYGCGTRMHSAMDDSFRGPPEMYAWKPAGRKELVLRREKQQNLDEIAYLIEQRFYENEDLGDGVQIIQASANSVERQLQRIALQTKAGIIDVLGNFNRIKTEMASVQTTGLGLDADFKKYDRYLELQKPFDPERYSDAVLLFKKGAYKESIKSFKKLLKMKPPYFLLDNIHFGIGTSYYKLKKYKKAEKTFDMIATKYSNGDKWPTAYVMMGLIYNETSRKSKAIYELQRALAKYMKPKDRKLMEKLLVLIQQDNYAGS